MSIYYTKSILKTPYGGHDKPTFFKCGITVGMTLDRELFIYAANQLKANPTWIPTINLITVAKDGFVELLNPEWLKPIEVEDVDNEIAAMQKFISGEDIVPIHHDDDTEDDIPF